MRNQVLAAEATVAEDDAEDDRKPPALPATSGRGRGSALRPRGGARGGGGGGPVVFYTIATVYASSEASKPILPVPIRTDLPHIRIALGDGRDDADHPVVSCIVDTAASLTTGNLDFWMALAKAFPWCVHTVYTSQNYREIILSGIVRQGEMPITTDLPVAFAFHMPYYTKDEGAPCTFIVACGKQVSVNCILGYTFLSATRGVVDLADMVVECKALDVPPFPIQSQRARLTANPAVERTTVAQPANMSQVYGAFLRELDDLEVHLATVYAAPVQESGAKRTCFDAADAAAARHPESPADSAVDDVPANAPRPSGSPPAFFGGTESALVQLPAEFLADSSDLGVGPGLADGDVE